MATRSKSRKGEAPKLVRYAVIGLGHIAQSAVLPAFNNAKRNSALAALVSNDDKKLRELSRHYTVERTCGYADIDELFASGDIDAVYIALPNDMHKEYVIKAARAGLHVLCEKPMAVTARECDEMIRATRKEKVKLMIAYRLHFERGTLEAVELARAGRLGELRYFSSDFSMQVADDNIRLNPSRNGGGPLYDIGVYCINAARYCFSAEPTEVWATATRSADRRFRNVDETICGVMRFGNERIASFTCSFGAADQSKFTLVGTRGSLTMDPAYEYAEGLAYELKSGQRSRKKQLSKSDQFAAELLYFSDCVLSNRDPEPSGEEGLADVRIVEGMLRSIATGRWVKLNLQQRKRRPSMQQEIRRPSTNRKPKVVNAQPASQ
jgi:predicted dehydrogenase